MARFLAWQPVAAGFVLMAVVLGGCSGEKTPAPKTAASTAAAPPAPTFVGSAACASCHPQETERWRGSHHDLAFQVADEASVLGSFDGRSARAFGVETTFGRRQGRPFVRTEGADGAAHDFEVTDTFGVEPLQQYLVALPGGRKQALSWAYDTRPVAEGGGRWFQLHPEERIPPADPLHWTSVGGSWNHQCAECHSTQVRKGYDAASASYATTFSEIDVGCESCHGPGSAHVGWAGRAREAGGAQASDASKGLVFQIGAGDGATWLRAPEAPIAHRSVKRTSDAELETCARCHSRRSVLSESYVHGRPILDSHRPALLDEGLYFADGQIQEEVYEYGSFLQSRMHAKGVTCSDCHDPHSLRLRDEGNTLCGRCHSPEVFDTGSHHHHEKGSVAARCVSCHAPTRTYMQVDARHDHGFRVPRPDLAAETGAPNACTGCHAKRSADWAARAIAGWRGAGRTPPPHFGSTLHAGRSGSADAEARLVALVQDESQPAIARATALRLLEEYLSPRSLPALQKGLGSADPLLRLAAAGAAAGLPPSERLALLGPLLRDPVLAVRIETALPLAATPPSLWEPGERAGLAGVLDEFRAAQAFNLDQPEAHVNLGNLHAALGEIDAAQAEYETAIRLAPWSIPAYVNLADLHRARGREPEAEALLRQAIARDPQNADVQHALGLALVRRKRMSEAVEALGRAAALAPDRSRYAVAFALALQAVGEEKRAAKVMADARARRPGDPEVAERPEEAGQDPPGR